MSLYSLNDYMNILERPVTMRNLGKEGMREGGKEGKGERRLNEKEEDLLKSSYFHICIFKQMHTYHIWQVLVLK